MGLYRYYMWKGDPNIGPQYTIVYIMGTVKKVPQILGYPLLLSYIYI